MILTDSVGIIADDLTGANDTALQFHIQGAKTKILIDTEYVPLRNETADVWAISTESRNCSAEEAIKRIESTTKNFANRFNFEYY